MSASRMPRSWKLSSVKFQPVWHFAQLAFALKSPNPRSAFWQMVGSRPARHSSKGATPSTTVRSNVAMALPSVSAVIPSPGYAASNIVR